jgi:nitrogen regulatory protein PII
LSGADVQCVQRLSVNPIGQIVTHEDLQALMECGYQVLGRFEIFLSRKRADEMARAILGAAQTGQPGDGLVAVLPVESLYRIASGELAT